MKSNCFSLPFWVSLSSRQHPSPAAIGARKGPLRLNGRRLKRGSAGIAQSKKSFLGQGLPFPPRILGTSLLPFGDCERQSRMLLQNPLNASQTLPNEKEGFTGTVVPILKLAILLTNGHYRPLMNARDGKLLNARAMQLKSNNINL